MVDYDIQTEYFFRMMLPSIKKVAAPFINEERNILESIIKTLPYNDNNKVAIIGAGSLSYLKIVLEHGLDYIAIEPLSHLYLQEEMMYVIEQAPNIDIINHQFGDFSPSSLPVGHYIYAFIFNVFAYIDKGLTKINKYLKSGDIIFISSWNLNNLEAMKVRDSYFNKIHESMICDILDPCSITTPMVSNLEAFDFSQLKYYKRHRRTTREYTDCLIIQC